VAAEAEDPIQHKRVEKNLKKSLMRWTLQGNM
jgi:hypothetical protein